MNSFDLKCIASKVGPQSTSTEAPCRDSLRPQPDSSGGSSRAGVAGEVGESRQMTEAPCSLALSPGYHAVVLHRHELIVILFIARFLPVFFCRCFSMFFLFLLFLSSFLRDFFFLIRLFRSDLFFSTCLPVTVGGASPCLSPQSCYSERTSLLA